MPCSYHRELRNSLRSSAVPLGGGGGGGGALHRPLRAFSPAVIPALPYCQVMVRMTFKTLCGPSGALVLANFFIFGFSGYQKKQGEGFWTAHSLLNEYGCRNARDQLMHERSWPAMDFAEVSSRLMVFRLLAFTGKIRGTSKE